MSEKIAAHYASAQYPGYTYVGSTKIGSNNGFDYVLSKNITLTDGTAAKEFIIVEIKGIRTGANPQLGVLSGRDTRGMVQMSPDWIKMNVKRLSNSKKHLLHQIGVEMGRESSVIRTDIAVIRPTGSDGQLYNLEFLGQKNTQTLIDRAIQSAQRRINRGG